MKASLSHSKRFFRYRIKFSENIKPDFSAVKIFRMYQNIAKRAWTTFLSILHLALSLEAAFDRQVNTDILYIGSLIN